jgi:hypothetical protein
LDAHLKNLKKLASFFSAPQKFNQFFIAVFCGFFGARDGLVLWVGFGLNLAPILDLNLAPILVKT